MMRYCRARTYQVMVSLWSGPERLSETFGDVWNAQTAVNEMQMAGFEAWIENEKGERVNDPNLTPQD